MRKRIVLYLLQVDAPVVLQSQRRCAKETVYPDQVQANLVRHLAPGDGVLEDQCGVEQVRVVTGLLPCVDEHLSSEDSKVV